MGSRVSGVVVSHELKTARVRFRGDVVGGPGGKKALAPRIQTVTSWSYSSLRRRSDTTIAARSRANGR